MFGWLFDVFRPKPYRLRKRLDKLRERLDLFNPANDDQAQKKQDIYRLLDDADDKLKQVEEGYASKDEIKYILREVENLLKQIEIEMGKLR